MRDYALPSQDECRAMIRDCHVPVHIVKHAEAVAKLGVFLAERLRDGGIDVDVALVEVVHGQVGVGTHRDRHRHHGQRDRPGLRTVRPQGADFSDVSWNSGLEQSSFSD